MQNLYATNTQSDTISSLFPLISREFMKSWASNSVSHIIFNLVEEGIEGGWGMHETITLI